MPELWQRITAVWYSDSRANIGKTMKQITWEFLRSIGFRFTSHGVDNTPHMILPVHQNQEVGLEICPNNFTRPDWYIWLRSDMAHSKCRFCFLRYVKTEDQLTKLIEAITDSPVQREDFDAERFAESLKEEQADCLRRYKEYALNDRWGRVPGGL